MEPRHGSPYDRGAADAYYQRPYAPHYYEGATAQSRRIELHDMTPEDIQEYDRGYVSETDSYFRTT